MTTIEFSHFENDMPTFEDYSIGNGGHYWYARDLMEILGYKNFDSFNKAINKSYTVCNSLDIDINENIIRADRDIGGKRVKDYKLTRFACYITVMNCDVRKPEVAKAQVYFAAMADIIHDYMEKANQFERVATREELRGEEKVLHGIVKEAGIDKNRYTLFHNAGYRGMYNMGISRLKQYKGLDQDQMRRSLLDFMGSTELAANLFRITQTRENIKTNNITGQRELEGAAEFVGKRVRKTMIETGGTPPENLSIEEDIKKVKTKLKKVHKQLKKADEPKPLKGGKQGEEKE